MLSKEHKHKTNKVKVHNNTTINKSSKRQMEKCKNQELYSDLFLVSFYQETNIHEQGLTFVAGERSE